MKKLTLLIPLLGLILFGCVDDPVFERSALAKTWYCQTNDHVSSFSSTTSYNIDGTFIGQGNLRVDLPKNKEPALLTISVKGTWSIYGSQFTTSIDENNIEAQNASGTTILKEAQRLASEMSVFNSNIISVEPSKVTYKEDNSYFKKTCTLAS